MVLRRQVHYLGIRIELAGVDGIVYIRYDKSSINMTIDSSIKESTEIDQMR
jgi:hypothetical protein